MYESDPLDGERHCHGESSSPREKVVEREEFVPKGKGSGEGKR